MVRMFKEGLQESELRDSRKLENNSWREKEESLRNESYPKFFIVMQFFRSVAEKFFIIENVDFLMIY